MGQNEGGRDEFIAEKQAELTLVKQALSEANEALKKAEAFYETAAALHKEKLQYDEVCIRLEEMRSLLPVMEEKRALAERIPKAKAVAREAQAALKNRMETETAKRAVLSAQENEQKALALVQETAKKQAESGIEERILQASMALEKVRSAAEDLKAEKEAERKYNECLAQYRECQY